MATVPVDRVDDTPNPAEGARLVYLDSLRIVLTAGVIVAHAAMTYGAAGTWVYEEPSLSDVAAGVLGFLVGVGVMFGLGLFFLIAGMLTTGPLIRRGPRGFLASRVWRLGVPLAAYALVVWPVLQWLTDRAEGDRQSLVEFYRFEFTGTRWRSLGTGPLWFVAILLVVTTGWTLWRWAKPAPVAAVSGLLTVRHLAVTAATIAVATFFVRVWFPVDSEQFLDLHVWLWPQSAALFVLGAIGSERGWLSELPESLRHTCHRAAIAAVVTLVVLIVLSNGPEPFKGGWYWEAAGYAAVEGVFSVSVALIVLDRFRRRHAEQGHLARRLGRSAYGAFVAQGPVLVLIASGAPPGRPAGRHQVLGACTRCGHRLVRPRRGHHHTRHHQAPADDDVIIGSPQPIGQWLRVRGAQSPFVGAPPTGAVEGTRGWPSTAPESEPTR